MSGGNVLPDASCTGIRPDQQRTIGRYDACTIDWVIGDLGAWSSTCSSSATRTRSVQCMRYGGTAKTVPVDETLCVRTRPGSTETAEVVTSCTYTAQYGTRSTCQATTEGGTTGTQSAPLSKCKRSDGTFVDISYCGGQPKITSCTISYTPSYGTMGACMPSSVGSAGGFTEEKMVQCTRSSDNASVPISYCNGGASRKTACSLSYELNYGTTAAYTSCTSGTQTKIPQTCIARSNSGAYASAVELPMENCAGVARLSRTCSAVCNNLASNAYVTKSDFYNTSSYFDSKSVQISDLTKQDAMAKDFCQKNLGPEGMVIQACMISRAASKGQYATLTAVYSMIPVTNVVYGNGGGDQLALASCTPG